MIIEHTTFVTRDTVTYTSTQRFHPNTLERLVRALRAEGYDASATRDGHVQCVEWYDAGDES